MCEDCGCMEGNARAYFDAHGHAETGGQGHVHTHLRADGQGGTHVHIHVHIEPGGGAHDHEHGHSHAHPHTHTHPHDHGHGHDHDHLHDHDHSHDHGGARTISLETNVLAKNDAIAAENRLWLASKGVAAVNMISSPGSGKTYLLERTLDALRGRVRAAVITGDQQTDNDAKRLEGKGAPVVQIETRSSCHLDAQQVRDRLEEVVSDGVELLLIENVGNLVCPAAFDLGEGSKIALLSVTEGEDKPLKYPVLFHDSPVCVITKTDLLPHLDTDIEKCRQSVMAVRPDAKIFEVSAKTGEGMDAWISFLTDLSTRAD